VGCSVLQTTVCCTVLQNVVLKDTPLSFTSVMQCVVVCCIVMQCVAVCCHVLLWVAARCSVLQCVVCLEKGGGSLALCHRHKWSLMSILHMHDEPFVVTRNPKSMRDPMERNKTNNSFVPTEILQIAG